MRVTRAEADKNRERIIETASRLFRERGFDGIGVAELMKVVGLTHGGFYGHFTSKEELISLASERALQQSLDALQQAVQHDSENALSTVVNTYLSATHRDHPGNGCMLASLGAEVARQDSPVRRVFTEGVRSVVDALTQLQPGNSNQKKRKRALSIYATMVGAIVLARAVDDADLSEEILKSALASIKNTESP